MSSNTYAAPLALEVQASPLFAVILAAVHWGAAILALLLPVPLWLGIAAAVLLLAHGVYVMRIHALLRARSAIVRLVWDAQDCWTLTRRDASTVSAQLSSGSFVHPQLTVLTFKVSRWRSCSVVILPGRIAADGFRKLRVRLALPGNSQG